MCAGESRKGYGASIEMGKIVGGRDTSEGKSYSEICSNEGAQLVGTTDLGDLLQRLKTGEQGLSILR